MEVLIQQSTYPHIHMLKIKHVLRLCLIKAEGRWGEISLCKLACHRCIEVNLLLAEYLALYGIMPLNSNRSSCSYQKKMEDRIIFSGGSIAISLQRGYGNSMGKIWNCSNLHFNYFSKNLCNCTVPQHMFERAESKSVVPAVIRINLVPSI